MKKYQKFDRYGNPIDDDDNIVRDGQSVRFPHMFMDAASDDEFQKGVKLAQASVHDGMGRAAGHRPGFCFSTDATLRDAADVAYEERRASISHAPVRKPASLADAQAAAALAYEERNQGLANAWRERSV